MKKRLSIVVVAVALLLLSLAAAPVFGGGDNGLEKADQARQKHTDGLLAKDGVVGVALGLNQAGKGAVVVFTAEAGVPGIPKKVDGVPVHVRVTGEIFALHHRPGHDQGGDEDPAPPPETTAPARPVSTALHVSVFQRVTQPLPQAP